MKRLHNTPLVLGVVLVGLTVSGAAWSQRPAKPRPVKVVRAETTGITILSGTYGGNCQQPMGNKTSFLAAACNGQTTCDYTVDYTVIGDPAPNCAKTYIAQWTCPGSSNPQSLILAAEAGFGSVAHLACPATPAIAVTSATYGANCGAPSGNVTSFLQTTCTGAQSCDYTVDYKVIGDPVPGCAKEYTAEWTCGDGVPQTVTVAAEAGFGSIAALSCPLHWPEKPDEGASSPTQAMPGWQGTTEIVTSESCWSDTDGVAPATAGCHVACSNGAGDCTSCGSPTSEPQIGEACFSFTQINSTGVVETSPSWLIETNPGANVCHPHAHGEGHPDVFDCNAYCQGTAQPGGGGNYSSGSCTAAASTCGGLASASCSCN